MRDGIINSPKSKIYSLYEKHPDQDGVTFHQSTRQFKTVELQENIQKSLKRLINHMKPESIL